MSSNWFYSSNGQQHGPISAAQLKQLADSGHLMPDDFVCQEGSEQWVVASKVKGLFAAPQTAQPISNEPVEALPQIQINVGKAIKGVGNTVQGIVQSEPVQSAAAAVQNAAGQAAEGVGNFIRSDAVQSQVGAANDFWSSLTSQNKLLVAAIGGVGLLMMSCCSCGIILNLAGFGSRDSGERTPQTQRTSSAGTPVGNSDPESVEDEPAPLIAEKLLLRFENAAAATREFGGKRITVIGDVIQVREGIAYHFRSGRMYYVQLAGKPGRNGYVSWINCFFANPNDISSSIRKGSIVTIEGEVVHGEETAIEMRNCKVVAERPPPFSE